MRLAGARGAPAAGDGQRSPARRWESLHSRRPSRPDGAETEARPLDLAPDEGKGENVFVDVTRSSA